MDESDGVGQHVHRFPHKDHEVLFGNFSRRGSALRAGAEEGGVAFGFGLDDRLQVELVVCNSELSLERALDEELGVRVVGHHELQLPSRRGFETVLAHPEHAENVMRMWVR